MFYLLLDLVLHVGLIYFLLHQPVYHIEVSDVATSEEGIFEVDNLIRETKQCSTSDRSTRDETVKDIIIERAEQLQTKLFKHKFTFVDSNFVRISFKFH